MTTLEIIKYLCEKEGIKISVLEKEMGYGNGSLSKANKIPAERVMELSKRFNVRMEYLMTGEESNGKDLEDDTPVSYDKLLKIYTRGKNNLTPEEKIKLAQIILADRNGQNGL